MAEEEKVTYICGLKNGRMRKVTVPAHWKVTYGPVVPATPRGGDHGGCALRFYEGTKPNEKQRAMFRDVEWFRESSIKVLEKTRREKSQTVRHKDKAGDRDVIMRGIIEDWEDPDNPTTEEEVNEFLSQKMQVIDFAEPD